jgi:hypothetical protein
LNLKIKVLRSSETLETAYPAAQLTKSSASQVWEPHSGCSLEVATLLFNIFPSP